MQEEQTTEQKQAVMPADPSKPPDEAPPPTVALAVDQRVATQQETRTLLQPMTSPSALAEYPKSLALYELSEVGLRGTSMVLLRTMVLEMEASLREARGELKTLHEMYNGEHLRTAVLEGRLRADRRLKILQNVFITVGGLVNTVSVKLLFDRQQSSGLFFLAVGITLVLSGWLWPKDGEEKR
jgi:hypothetical protein